MRFIMVHRKTVAGTTPTWVNIDNINTISAASIEPEETRVTMRDGFLVVEDDVAAVLEKIRRAEDR